MNLNFVKLVVILNFLLTLNVLPARAEGLKTTYGRVVEVSENKIVLMQYVDNQPTNLEYKTDPDTLLQEVASLSEIKKGDGVKITFFTRGEERLAKLIVLSNPALERARDASTGYVETPQRAFFPE